MNPSLRQRFTNQNWFVSLLIICLFLVNSTFANEPPALTQKIKSRINGLISDTRSVILSAKIDDLIEALADSHKEIQKGENALAEHDTTKANHHFEESKEALQDYRDKLTDFVCEIDDEDDGHSDKDGDHSDDGDDNSDEDDKNSDDSDDNSDEDDKHSDDSDDNSDEDDKNSDDSDEKDDDEDDEYSEHNCNSLDEIRPLYDEANKIITLIENLIDGVVLPPSNQAPLANAGLDQTVALGSIVQLNASASSDPDSDPISYLWSIFSTPLGSLTSISDLTLLNPTLLIDKPGEYKIELTVNDGLLDSQPDNVLITTINSPPVANAGPDQTVFVSQIVTLDASGSNDVDGDLLNYTWLLTSVPDGSSAVLSDITGTMPTLAIDKPGTYVVRLIVNDGKTDSTAAFATITTKNSQPVANAGSNQTVFVGDTAQLDGSGSSDVDGDLLTFNWSLMSAPFGSSAAISSNNVVTPTFLVDLPGSYVAQLIVNDGVLDSVASTVSIVTQNSPPTAVPGNAQTVFVDQQVFLDGGTSNDADGDPLSYSWSFVSRPLNSVAAISNKITKTTDFIADLPGTYVIQLIVNDGTVDSRPVNVSINTQNSRPVASAGSDKSVFLGQNVVLDGTASFDVDNDPLTYDWSLIKLPGGSTVIFNNPTTIQPNFTPDFIGSYIGQLIVKDGILNSDPDTVNIQVNALLNNPPVANAGADQTAFIGQQISLDGSSSFDPDGAIITFNWVLNKPNGSTTVLDNPVAPQPSFTPDIPGTYTGQLIVNDGNVNSLQDLVDVFVTQNANPVIITTAITQATLGQSYSYDLDATDDNGDILNYSLINSPAGMVIGALSGLIQWTPILAGSFDVSVKVNDGKGGTATQSFTIVVQDNSGLPPDPKTIAPSIDRTVATTIHTSTEFLYTGNNPIQTGVLPGTINPIRAAVLRGKVSERSGIPLSGVTISVLNHPEYGHTLSRTDGEFDLAVNGGGILTVRYERDGFLPAQRQIKVTAQDYTQLFDVALIRPDSKVTTINLANSTVMQVAQATIISDNNGTRQATLLFPSGTTANIINPDGSMNPQSILNVRATEYTVGPEGLAAMPAKLPPNSGYTYAVELGVDEATTKINGKDVFFNQPIIYYLENFLNVEIGSNVPVGYYDSDNANWIPSDNGLVVAILNTNNGIAALDVDGTGIAATTATLSGLGITGEEQQKLAQIYQPGQTLWRVALTHFSTWDMNWPFSPPSDAESAQDDPKQTNEPEPDPDRECASIIECQNQILGETVGITGTPFSLNYRSDRVFGRKSAYKLDIPLSRPIVPASLIGIEVKISVAGREFTHAIYNGQGCAPATFASFVSEKIQNSTSLANMLSDSLIKLLNFVISPTEAMAEAVREMIQIPRPWHCDLIDNGQIQPTSLNDQNYTFTWDGKDIYGRLMQGRQPVTVRIGYLYRGVYQKTDRFGYNGNGTITGSRARRTVTLWRKWKSIMGGMDFRNQGLGAWSIDVHHHYDTLDRKLYLGDGSRHSAKATVSRIISAFASFTGNNIGSCTGNGGPARGAALGNPNGLAIGADGSVYFADCDQIRKVDLEGIITAVAGTGTKGFSGDGGPAILAQLHEPSDIAVGPDGSLYIADTRNQRIRRVSPNGIITTIAGINTPPGTQVGGFSGDNGPAIKAELGLPTGVAVGPDGSVYIADKTNHRIRRILTDGTIITIAGSPLVPPFFRPGFSGDGGLATKASLSSPEDLVVAADGTVYIADTLNARVRQVTPDGIIQTIAGNGDGVTGFFSPNVGDGGLATDAAIKPIDVAIGPDGTLYIADEPGRIRRVDHNGIVNTVAGSFNPQHLENGNDGPATSGKIPGALQGLAVGAEMFYISAGRTVRQVTPFLPNYLARDFKVASEDGSEVYFFDAFGRHLQTRHSLTGAVLYDFTYNTSGLLVEIKDGDGNITRIERDVSNNPTAIIAPFGQRTTLTLDANGYLVTISNPASEQYQMVYTNDGLLTEFKDPRNNSSIFAYDPVGNLLKDTNADLGFFQLSRVDNGPNYDVSVTTALNRTTNHRVDNLPTGDQQRINTFPDGTKTTSLINTNGTTTNTLADGTSTELIEKPDPRFGMQSPLLQSSKVTNGNLTSISTLIRNVNLLDPNDLFSLSSLTDKVTINGRISTSTYDAATRTFTNTSAEGRQTTQGIDAQARIIQQQIDGLLPAITSYDIHGRLKTKSIGTGIDQRLVNFDYNLEGYLATQTDPLGRITGFEYDLAGRVTRQVFPNAQEILYRYDANGNLASLTPPGRPAHIFNYTKVDLTDQYTPPDINIGTTSTIYHYNLDKQLTQVSRPDGKNVIFSYDAIAERLIKLTTPLGDTLYGYDAITGKLTNFDTPDGEGLAYSFNGALISQIDWSGTVTGNVGYNYDNDLRIASMSVNGADTIAYTYDKDSLLTQVGNLTLTRNVHNGLITGSSLGLITDTYGYNSFGEISDYLAQINGLDTLNFQYIYDKLGRISQKTETENNVTNVFEYDYDLTGRLTTVTKNNVVQTAYGYDSNGNRVTVNGTVIATYDNQDRLLTFGNASYTYSVNGELQSKTESGTTTRYSFDVLGNLRQVVLPGNVTIDYVIDGQNRRIGKKINETLVQGFLYQDQLNPVAELDGGGNIISQFIYAGKSNVPDYMIKNGSTYRIISDHLGSPRLVINIADGVVAQRMDFDVWGNVILDTNPGFQPFGFAGGLYDLHSSFNRFGARDYDPLTGQWTSKDPILFDGGDSNLYGYTLNDPINFIDPTGKIIVPHPAVITAILFCLNSPGCQKCTLDFTEGLFGPTPPDSLCGLAGTITGICISLPYKQVFRDTKREFQNDIRKVEKTVGRMLTNPFFADRMMRAIVGDSSF